MGVVKHLFLGRNDGAGADLLKVGDTFQDDGEDYNGFAKSDPLAPAGLGGEAAFYTLYVPVTFDTDNTPLRVKVYLDDALLITRDFTLANPADPTQLRTTLEISLMQKFDNTVVGYNTAGLFAPRGCWFQVSIETVFLGGTAFVQIDGVEVEYEVVQEGKQEGQNNP